ncbi:universal stress protein [Acidobacteria bacterium AB60]|nr:universal stress protein [Acidobacteria bacterium AB60]
MIERILVAYDESQEAERALKTGIDLCRALGADLKVVTVAEPLPSYYSFAPSATFALHWKEEQANRCSVLQRRARVALARSGVYPDAEVVPGDEVGTIVACAKRFRADLLILGLRRHARMSGHTGQHVAEMAPCSVLGVR